MVDIFFHWDKYIYNHLKKGKWDYSRRWLELLGKQRYVLKRRLQFTVECTVGRGGGRRVWFLWKHCIDLSNPSTEVPTRVESVTNSGRIEGGVTAPLENANCWCIAIRRNAAMRIFHLQDDREINNV